MTVTSDLLSFPVPAFGLFCAVADSHGDSLTGRFAFGSIRRSDNAEFVFLRAELITSPAIDRSCNLRG